MLAAVRIELHRRWTDFLNGISKENSSEHSWLHHLTRTSWRLLDGVHVAGQRRSKAIGIFGLPAPRVDAGMLDIKLGTPAE
jgi:hypothetical protein